MAVARNSSLCFRRWSRLVELSSLLILDESSSSLWAALVEHAQRNLAKFGLVVVRLSGLMVLGPFLGPISLPFRARALLTMALALIITPVLSNRPSQDIDHVQQNRQHGSLLGEERPADIQSQSRGLTRASYERPQAGSVSEEYIPRPVALPDTLGGYVVVALGELLLGYVLSLGVLVVLSGLQIAGQLIDQQAGFGLGEIIHPDFDSTGSITGQTLMIMGSMIFLILEPWGGHLILFQALLHTFETMPLGEAYVSRSALELVVGLMQEAFILGVRVAAPLVVMMTLIDITLGFLSHSVPQVNLQAVGFAVRAGWCLLVISCFMTGVGETVVEVVSDSLTLVCDAVVFPTRNG